jgi:hypothetical protein
MDTHQRHFYMASRDWARLKEQLRIRSHGKCERCRRAPYEETHHLTYERLGHEFLDDLQALCAPCHEYLSGKSDVDPLTAGIPGLPCSPTLEAIEALGLKLTEQIRSAGNNERKIEKLLMRKQKLIRVQAQYVLLAYASIYTK